MTYVIDGYNLLHRAYRGLLSCDSLREARRRLEEKLVRFQRAGGTGTSVLLVFDGAAPASAPEPGSREGFRVIYSTPPQTADDLILDICREREGDRELAVVTSDLTDIGHRVRGLRIRHLTSEEFAAMLESGAAAGAAAEGATTAPVPDEKPRAVSRQEIRDWLREFDLGPEDET